MSIAKVYSRGIKRAFRNYWPAWSPTTRFRVGDVGMFERGLFVKKYDLAELGVTFEVREDGATKPLELVSSAGISWMLKAEGEINDSMPNIPAGDAGLSLRFDSAGAFVVMCPHASESTIANGAALEDAIRTGYRASTWKSEWCVIVRLVSAPVGSFLISESAGSALDLSARSNMTSLMDLARVGTEMTVRRQAGQFYKSLGAHDVSPIFQVARLKHNPFWGGSSFRTFAARGDGASHDPVAPGEMHLRVVEDSEVDDSVEAND